MRGVGSSPANPGVTTYIDGVPQLNANTSSIELLDVGAARVRPRTAERALRPQRARRPGQRGIGSPLALALDRQRLCAARQRIRARAARRRLGPARQRKARARRVHGVRPARRLHPQRHHRAARSTIGPPSPARRSCCGRRPPPGRRAPSSPASARATATTRCTTWRAPQQSLPCRARLRRLHAPRHREHDRARAARGRALTFSTTTGFVRWKTEDATDLDYSPLPLVTRENAEEAFQFTQEVRLASAANARVRAVRRGRAQVAERRVPVHAELRSGRRRTTSRRSSFPRSSVPRQPDIAAGGAGRRGRRRVRPGHRDAARSHRCDGGARFDYENKEGQLSTFYTPADRAADRRHRRAELLERLAAARRGVPPGGRTARCMPRVSRGFKAGGFNPASPAGQRAYGEEHTWHVEGGIKASWARPRVGQRRRVLHRLGRSPAEPAGSGGARAVLHRQRGRGDEHGRRGRGERARHARGGRRQPDDRRRRVRGVRVHARAVRRRQRSRAASPVAGNELPNAPDYTATFGAQFSRALREAVAVYGRAEAVFYGAYFYDDANTRGRTRTRWPTSAPARAAATSSPRRGSGTRSIRGISRSRSRCHSRRRDSSERWAGRGRSGSEQVSRSESRSVVHASSFSLETISIRAEGPVTGLPSSASHVRTTWCERERRT